MAQRYNKVRPPNPIALPRITPFHVEMLDVVYKHRWVTYRQIASILQKKYEGVRTPLHALWANKYILRPHCQYTPGFLFEPNDRLHIIADKGADILRQAKGYSIPPTDYDKRELDGWVNTWKHDSTATDFRVSFLENARTKGLDLITIADLDDTTLETSTGKIYPDDTIILIDPAIGSKNALFFVEIDMGTEQIERNPQKTNIQDKLQKYLDAFSEKTHTDKYGLNNMRVLFLTTSKDRIQNIISKLPDAPKIFLFATFQDMKSPLDIEWTNNKGEKVKLL